MAGELAGQVAVISGGSQGLGLAIAHGLAASGATVVVASRDAATCSSAAESISAATAGTAIGHACDVTDEDAVTGLLGFTTGEFGRWTSW